MTNELDLAFFEKIIQLQLDELHMLEETRTESTRVVTLDQTATGRLSRMDALQQQEMAKDRTIRANLEIKRLVAALERCRNGTYGHCAECEELINPRRLELYPTALHCIQCEERRPN